MCTSYSFLYSQNTTNRVYFVLSKDSINTSNSEMAEFTVQLTNPLTSEFSGSLLISPGPGVELISKINTSVHLQPSESYFTSVKFFVPKKMTSDQVGKVKITLLDSEGKPAEEKFFSFTVASSKSVVLLMDSKELLLKKSLDSLHIAVKLSNTGNTDQKVLIVASYPAILKKSSNQQKLFELRAFCDTIVYFHKRVTSEMFKVDGFNIIITGLYFNGDAFGNQVVNAQPAKSTRLYSESRGLNAGEIGAYNTLTLSGQNLGTPNEWYQVLSSGSLAIRQQKIYYNLDASIYKQSYGQGVQLRNTFITYRKDDWGVTAGNLSKNFDINVSGRGVLAFMDDSAHTHYAEAGYINKAQNLFSKTEKGQVKPGDAAWASYSYTTDKLMAQAAVIYDMNTFSNTRSVLLNSELRWLVQKKYTVRAIVNAGRENSVIVKDSTRAGYGAGLAFEGSLGKFYVTSSNYLSSMYYPGTTKGTLNLNERVSWAQRKYNLWLGTSYIGISPAPIPGLNYSFSSSRLRAETGISFTVRKINVSLSPSFAQETGSNAVNGKSSMTTGHLSVSMNYLSPLRNASFFFTTEGGLYSSSVMAGSHFHQKTMLNLRYKIASLNVMHQAGSFYLSELVYSGSKRNSLLMVGPQFQKDIFSHRARIQWSASFTTSTVGGISFQQSGMLEYDYSLRIRLFAGADYNYYKATNYQYTNIRAGVTLKLPEPKMGTKAGNTLEVFLYRDINENGVYDKEDSIAGSSYVTINNMIFITDPNGLVKYKNLPEGYYRISAMPVKGWVGLEKLIPSMTRNMRVEIPMQRTGLIKGSISYIFNKFSYDAQKNKDGVIISAVNSRGDRFTAMTNEDGQFILYLPSGEYDIDLKRDNMPAEIEIINNYKDVAITPKGVFQADFVLKVKERKVETKKFTSSSVTASR